MRLVTKRRLEEIEREAWQAGYDEGYDEATVEFAKKYTTVYTVGRGADQRVIVTKVQDA